MQKSVRIERVGIKSVCRIRVLPPSGWTRSTSAISIELKGILMVELEPHCSGRIFANKHFPIEASRSVPMKQRKASLECAHYRLSSCTREIGLKFHFWPTWECQKKRLIDRAAFSGAATAVPLAPHASDRRIASKRYVGERQELG